MKKLLALLLALFLPGCAAAETYGLSVSVDVNEELFALYARQALQADPAYASYDLDTLVAAMTKSLNGLGFDLAAQEDAMSLLVRLGAGELLNVTLHTTDEAVFLTSPMLYGYALWDAKQGTAEKSLQSSEWESVCGGMGEALSRWLADFEPIITNGVFDGDAYAGGTQCTLWTLSDMDIAALASSLATEELRALSVSLMEVMGLNASELLTLFNEENARVAAEDTYWYMLRVVTNDADEFVGASLTVLQDVAQVATISLGMTEKTFKLVVGLGLNEQNYWWELTGKQSQLRNITYLSGTSREWIADKDESYSFVSVANAPLSSHMLRCTLTQSGNRYLWDGNISIGDESAYEYVCSSSGTLIPSTGTLDCIVSLGDAPYEPVRMTIRLGPVETIAPMDSSLQLCSMSDPAEATLCQELMDKFAASIMARMIKLLPMDTIMTLEKITLPE